MRILKAFIILIVLTFYISPFQTLAATTTPQTTPKIQSESAVLMDSSTGQVLFEKNGNKRMYPASLTKIATAIIAIEQGNLNDIVTVSQKAHDVDGTRVYLEVGEKVTMYKLLQGLLINSGNDAAIAIAEHMDGSVEAFSKRLNNFLENTIKTKNTNFTNPHGLYDPNHYTTAYDLALMMKYALKNDIFRSIISTKKLKWDGKGWHTTLYNHHKMLRERPYPGIIGGKTGYVDQSKHTLATAAKRGGTELIAIVLKANTKKMAYDDTEKLLDYGFNSFQNESIPIGKMYTTISHQAYITTSLIRYKKKKDEDVSYEVSENGDLVIKDKHEKIIFTHPLTKVKTNSIMQAPKSPNKKQDSQKQSNVWGASIIAMILLVGLIGFILKNRQDKNIKRNHQV